jgi:hypothetical protein
MKASRRTILSAAIVAGLCLVLGFIARFSFVRAEDIIIAILRRRLGFLDIEAESFEDFASRYVAHKADQRRKLEILAVLSPLWAVWTPYAWLPMGHPLRRLEDNVVSNFLQSTDFFQNGADETRRVQYLGFFMVGDTRCPNPFARTHYTRKV